MLGDHRVEKSGDDLLLGPGQLGDGVELLFELGNRAAPGASWRGGGDLDRIVVGDQRLDGDAEHLRQAGKHGDGHAALADLVEGELGLRDTERLGELHLRQIGGSAGLGNALAERLSDPHPIIAGWIAGREEAIAKNRLVADIWANRPVRAAPFTPIERRRLRVLDALFRTLEAAKIVVAETGRRGLVARCGRDEIEFQVKPKLKEVRQPLTPEERRWYAGKEYRRELVETDALVFEIKRWLPGDLPRKWQDGRKGTIEAMAGDILVTLIAAFPLMAAARERAEERQRLREFEEQQRYELAQEQKVDRDRFRHLLELAGKWREAELARDFLGALRAAFPDASAQVGDKQAAEWLEWAEARASAHDPLRQDPLGVFQSIAEVTERTYRDR